MAEQEIAEKREREKYADRNPPLFQNFHRYLEKEQEDYCKINPIENRIIDDKKADNKYYI